MNITFVPSSTDPAAEEVVLDGRHVGRILWHPVADPCFILDAINEVLTLRFMEQVSQRLRYKASLARKP